MGGMLRIGLLRLEYVYKLMRELVQNAGSWSSLRILILCM